MDFRNGQNSPTKPSTQQTLKQPQSTMSQPTINFGSPYVFEVRRKPKAHKKKKCKAQPAVKETVVVAPPPTKAVPCKYCTEVSCICNACPGCMLPMDNGVPGIACAPDCWFSHHWHNMEAVTEAMINKILEDDDDEVDYPTDDEEA